MALAVAAACVPQPALTACTRCRLRRFYSVSDLATFSQLNGVPQPDVTVVGSNNSSEPGGEATLDIQLVTSTGQGIPTFFWCEPAHALSSLAVHAARCQQAIVGGHMHAPAAADACCCLAGTPRATCCNTWPASAAHPTHRWCRASAMAPCVTPTPSPAPPTAIA